MFVCMAEWVGEYLWLERVSLWNVRNKNGKDDPDCGLSHFRASALHLTLFLRCFGIFKPTQACTRLRCLEIMCVYITFVRGPAEIVQWTRGNRKITIGHIHFYRATPSPPRSILCVVRLQHVHILVPEVHLAGSVRPKVALNHHLGSLI